MKKKIITLISTTVFSIILWGFVTLSDEYFTTIQVPVNLVDLPENISIGNLSTESVSISMKGEGWTLAGYTFGPDRELTIKSKEQLGKQTIVLRNAIEQNPWLASNIQIVEIQPDRLEYTLENIASKKVEIIPDITLDFRPGYKKISDVVLTPDSIEISGPASLVKSTDFVKTVQTRLNNLEKDVSETLSFEPIKGIKFKHPNCIMEFSVQRIVDKSFDDILVATRNVPPARDLILFPSRIKVTLRGGINVLAKLDASQISASISFREVYNDTTGGIKPNITIPDNTELVDIKPNRLEYVIKKY
ncbi:MAG: hypothetical protein K9J16_05865 [Melioribacteraceae bacterium]|nr:hypothetical protein [Melioribacteraceae bacterium]MCF8355271.1 hypothetical protein [Melioribacteraceae bacterium]MCF8394170.1 hypothetical protein [Melioribacteraceae bacterium]MCF8418853.1 hypothetical protein [Melioribacteraceae bacterium]